MDVTDIDVQMPELDVYKRQDLRRGMDGLATIIRFRFQLDPYDKNTLFLFCGKKTDRIKGLLWEGDGFLLLYKRLSNGAFNWPRSVEEALEISPEQYTMLSLIHIFVTLLALKIL